MKLTFLLFDFFVHQIRRSSGAHELQRTFSGEYASLCVRVMYITLVGRAGGAGVGVS